MTPTRIPLTPNQIRGFWAAWGGWVLDGMDSFIYALVLVPALRDLLPRSGIAATNANIGYYGGILFALFLVGWGMALLWGPVADRFGRVRTLMLTIICFSVFTLLSAFATNIWMLAALRLLAGVGIGGEWGIGTALVAESVPEARRVEAGVIMQTASPLGLILAGAINYQIAGVWFVDQPQHAWRYVFLAGLLPVLLAVVLRLVLRESAPWQHSRAHGAPPTPRELLAPGMRRATLSGFCVAVFAVLTFWGCSAFFPLLGSSLAQGEASALGLSATATRTLSAAWQAYAANAFNLGGLVGALAAVPLARLLMRRAMFVTYFLFAAASLLITFGTPLPPHTRLALLFAVGMGVYGIFGTLTFYLPELFPARLRATGAGLCYNIGRVFAAAGPFIVGYLAARAGGSSAAILHMLLWCAAGPLLAALVSYFVVVETRGRTLPT